MVDWFNAIRAARFHYLQVAFPGASDEEVGMTSLQRCLIISELFSSCKMEDLPQVHLGAIHIT